MRGRAESVRVRKERGERMELHGRCVHARKHATCTHQHELVFGQGIREVG